MVEEPSAHEEEPGGLLRKGKGGIAVSKVGKTRLGLPGYVRLFVTLWTVTCQAPLSMRFSRQEYWSVLLEKPICRSGSNS